MEVFLSYSHRDEDLRNELEKHLSILKRQGAIDVWSDHRIGPGEEIGGQIDQHLESADVILLLVSSDFLDSDYCYDVEMARAMERHEQGEARVIPVILRPCAWHGAPFGHLKAIPTDGKPVVKHPTLDDGFLEVVEAVSAVANSRAGNVLRTPEAPRRETGTAAVERGPRSSNLRVKKAFTDHERHAFLTDTFDYVAHYFENSLEELQSRNHEVKTDFRRIDADRFEARAFVGGREESRCGIWLGGLSRTDSLFFSFDGVGGGNSYNESMMVHDDGYTLFLEPMGMAQLAQQVDKELTREGAAEYFWSLFVERLR
jgi:hypothetical protein